MRASNNDVRLRFSNKVAAQQQRYAVMVEENELEPRENWAHLHKDVLKLVSLHVTRKDRGCMRLVCKDWSQHVSITDNDGERIALGRANARKAKVRAVKECLKPATFIVLLLASIFAAVAGLYLIFSARVPESLAFQDLVCVVDMPLAMVCFRTSVLCNKNTVTRYKCAVAVSNGTSALPDTSDYWACSYGNSAEQARNGTEAYLAAAGWTTQSVACVAQGDASPLLLKDVPFATEATILRSSLLLNTSRQYYMMLFAIAVVCFVFIPFACIGSFCALCRRTK